MPTKPRVRKAGHDCWAATTSYYCEELGETMHTTYLFRTWKQAMQFAQKEQR